MNYIGPAFPSMRDRRSDPDFDNEPGMDLRDWFATHASEEEIQHQINLMDGVLKIRTRSDGSKYESYGLPDNHRQVARYRHADAMLEARKS